MIMEDLRLYKDGDAKILEFVTRRGTCKITGMRKKKIRRTGK